MRVLRAVAITIGFPRSFSDSLPRGSSLWGSKFPSDSSVIAYTPAESRTSKTAVLKESIQSHSALAVQIAKTQSGSITGAVNPWVQSMPRATRSTHVCEIAMLDYSPNPLPKTPKGQDPQADGADWQEPWPLAPFPFSPPFTMNFPWDSSPLETRGAREVVSVVISLSPKICGELAQSSRFGQDCGPGKYHRAYYYYFL